METLEGTDPLLIGTSDVARLLGVTPRTVTRMAKDGRLPPAHSTPNGVLFALTSVQAYLQDQEGPAQPAPIVPPRRAY